MTNKSKAIYEDLFEFEPQTKNQELAYKAWDDGDNLVLAGSAGTGKTFVPRLAAAALRRPGLAAALRRQVGGGVRPRRASE